MGISFLVGFRLIGNFEWIKWLLNCRKLPFQEKHVLQQASILGNLADFGILENPVAKVVCPDIAEPLCSDRSSEDKVPAVVEFGAGRGYLTQMLADCYGIKKVFLVERKSYKLKVSWLPSVIMALISDVIPNILPINCLVKFGVVFD